MSPRKPHQSPVRTPPGAALCGTAPLHRPGHQPHRGDCIFWVALLILPRFPVNGQTCLLA